MARIKDTSVEAVKVAADFVDIVSARTQLRKSGGRYSGRCPFHDERTPSFSVNAVDKLYYCFGCGAKGDLITFVRETEGLDFTERDRVAGRAVPGAGRVRGELARPGRGAQAPRAPRCAARAGDVVLRAHALGVTGRRDGARLPEGPWPRRGDLSQLPARPGARRHHARTQGTGERLHPRGAARRRPDAAAR